MSRSTIFLAVSLVALLPPAFADAPQAEPPADQQPVAEKPGLMTRFAKLFEPLDTTRPENQHVFVIGGGSATPKAVEAGNEPAGAAAVPVAANGSNADSPGSTPANAPTPPAKIQGHGFTLKSGFAAGDEQKPDQAAAHPPQ